MTHYIDPGATKGCAVATFLPGENRPAFLAGLGIWGQEQGFADNRWGMYCGGTPMGAVWEMPQYYPSTARASKAAQIAKANDLIALAAAGSACATTLAWGRGGVRSVLPRQWKGQLPKPITHWHALRVLTEGEIELLIEAYQATSARGPRNLRAYIQAGVDWCAKNPGKPLRGYSAKITDLLDAVCLGLVEEERLCL